MRGVFARKPTGRKSNLYNGTVSEKICLRCNQIKPLASFYKNKDKSPRGWRYVSYCSECHNLTRWPLNQALRIKRQEELAGRPKPTQCEICCEVAEICWDHDHNSGAFRGWVCRRCNRTLGFVKDNADLLRHLADYIENKRQ